MSHALAEHVRLVTARLEAILGVAQWPGRSDPADMLIACVLSQHTADANSERAYATLRERFPTWQDVADAEIEPLADAIRFGGLAQTKAPRIREIVRRVIAERGSFDLSLLDDMTDAEARAWLLNLPGVGPKCAAIVLCFALGRPEVPVDTHVFRVASRLGIVEAKRGVSHAHDALREIVPPELAYRFHMALIHHGRTVCRPTDPKCARCVLLAVCPCGQERTRAVEKPL